MICGPENPGMNGAVYHTPYIEAVEGYEHAHSTRLGVAWTRNPQHPEDPKCPGCNKSDKSAGGGERG